MSGQRGTRGDSEGLGCCVWQDKGSQRGRAKLPAAPPASGLQGYSAPTVIWEEERLLMVAEAGPQVNARQPEHRVWARVNSCRGGGVVRETSRAGREPVCFQGETVWVSLV